MSYNFKKAQILIITLLILTMLGILLVGVISITSRDANEVATTEKYNEIYNYAETNIKDFINKYGLYTVPLSRVEEEDGDFSNPDGSEGSCNEIIPNREYECSLSRSDLGTIATGIETKITAIDTREVRDYQLYKDRTLDLTLNGYREIVNFTWTNPVALELNLIVRDQAGKYKTIRDVYENAPTNVFDSLSGYNHFVDPDNIHPFPFQVLDGANLSNSMRFRIGDIVGLDPSDTTLFISVTPRIRPTDPSSTLLTITPSSAIGYPYQMRTFTAVSYDSLDTSTPLPELETSIPLTPQIDSLFDYSLITSGGLAII